MDTTDVQDVVQHLKLLANETRLRLLGLLSGEERSVGELAEIVDLKEPTISHHLRKLAMAGLVGMRAEGTTHLYSLNSEALHRLSRALFTPERGPGFVGPADASAWERKVLGTYVEGERLIRVPASRKKREVVLRWLADHFERNRRYSEREVSETIKRLHPDFTTLRRELIGAGLMQREAGIYWRVTPEPGTAGQ